MLFGNDRETYRKVIFEAWRKFNASERLEPIEQQLVTIIKMHPEYHAFFTNEEKNLAKDFVSGLDQVNPFLHIAIHQAVLDQISIDSPPGIRQIYQQLIELFQDPHEAEHCIGNSLVTSMFEMQKSSTPFDNEAYLENLRKILRE